MEWSWGLRELILATVLGLLNRHWPTVLHARILV